MFQGLDVAELIRIFMAGLILANGPCLFICVPIILPCITGLPYSGSDVPRWKLGLKFALIFSAARLTAYGFLGLASVVFYRVVFAFIIPKGVYAERVLGILVIGIGIFYFFHMFFMPNDQKHSACGCRRFTLDGRSTWHIVLFGLLIGFSPCPPLLGMLTYIAATAGDPWTGLGAGLIFGAGTLITPLIPLSVFTGFVADKIKNFSGVSWVIRFLSSAVLIYFGSRIIFR